MTYEQIQNLFDRYYELCLLPLNKNKKQVVDEIWEVLDTHIISKLDNELLNIFKTVSEEEKENVIHLVFRKMHNDEVKNKKVNTLLTSYDIFKKDLWDRRN